MNTERVLSSICWVKSTTCSSGCRVYSMQDGWCEDGCSIGKYGEYGDADRPSGTVG